MKNISITGRLTRDAETRQAGSDNVTRFSVAVDDIKGKERNTIYFDCDIWGKRGTSLQPSLTKGTSVAVCGEFSTREHNGKTYMTIRVDGFDFTGPKVSREPSEPKPQERTGNSDVDFDEVPF